MNDVNKVFLTGRLTFDPELRHTANGSATTTLRMATNRSWKDKNDEWQEKTTFVDVDVWGDSAERLCTYLVKGSFIHVEGSLELQTWEDKTSGEKRSKLVVKADKVLNLGGVKSKGEDGEDAPAPKAAKGTKPPKNTKPKKADDDEDGEIPF